MNVFFIEGDSWPRITIDVNGTRPEGLYEVEVRHTQLDGSVVYVAKKFTVKLRERVTKL